MKMLPLGGSAWQEGEILDLDGLLLKVNIPKACEHMLKTATHQSESSVKTLFLLLVSL